MTPSERVGLIAWGALILAFGLGLAAAFVAGRSMRFARLLGWAAGLLASLGLLYAATDGTMKGPWVVVWVVIPVALALFFWWRGHQQGDWMDRVAGRTGRVYGPESTEVPSFGVLPAGGDAVDRADPRAGYAAALETDLDGERVLGVDFRMFHARRLGDGKPQRSRRFEQIDMLFDGYHLVQVRIPEVPALLVESGVSVLVPEGLSRGHMHFGSERKPADLAVSPEFDAVFVTRTADPGFARAVLTRYVQELLLAEPWFRGRTFACQGDVLWFAGKGRLTERRFHDIAQRIVRLAQVLDLERYGTPDLAP